VTADDAGNAYQASANLADSTAMELRLTKRDRGGHVLWERRFPFATHAISTRAVTPAPGGGVALAVSGGCVSACSTAIDFGGGPIADAAVVLFDADGRWVSQIDLGSAADVAVAADGRWHLAVVRGTDPDLVLDVRGVDGSVAFQTPVRGGASAPAFAPDGTVMVGARATSVPSGWSVSGYGASGAIRWKCPASSGRVPSPVLALGNQAVASSERDAVVVRDVPGCVERFRTALDFIVTSLLPAADGGAVAMGIQFRDLCTVTRIAHLDARGNVTWRRELPPPGAAWGTLSVTDGAVAADGASSRPGPRPARTTSARARRSPGTGRCCSTSRREAARRR
jgi:hypothetical protein